jgi:thiamine-monophosphate kinase
MSRADRKRSRLGPGAEFDLIRRFVGTGALPPEVLTGPGDDAAVLEGGWVLTVDVSVEDVHFRRAWLSDREIGYRAAAGAFSDLAAMAARPVAALVTLAAPRGGRVDVEEVHAGVRELCESVGASVIGGDLSRSPGPLVIDVVAIGRAARPLPRSGAEPEDEVWVTGSLGASAAAVYVWETGGAPSPELREAFARPRLRIAEARTLADASVAKALIDVSDGIAGDAGHVAAASGVRITLEAAAIPVAPAAVATLGAERAFDLALHGGEDYELCFVARPGTVDPAAFERAHGVPLTRVGWVSEVSEVSEASAGEGVWIHDWEGETHPVGRGGFDHWGST